MKIRFHGPPIQASLQMETPYPYSNSSHGSGHVVKLKVPRGATWYPGISCMPFMASRGITLHSHMTEHCEVIDIGQSGCAYYSLDWSFHALRRLFQIKIELCLAEPSVILSNSRAVNFRLPSYLSILGLPPTYIYPPIPTSLPITTYTNLPGYTYLPTYLRYFRMTSPRISLSQVARMYQTNCISIIVTNRVHLFIYIGEDDVPDAKIAYPSVT